MKTILFTVLAVAAVALAGVLGYQKLTQPELSSALPETVTTAINQPVATTSDETVGWKTYQNQERDFEVKYPENWVVKVGELYGGNVFVSPEFVRCQIDIFLLETVTGSKSKTVPQWIEEQKSQGVVGGYKAIKVGNFSGFEIQGFVTSQYNNIVLLNTDGTRVAFIVFDNKNIPRTIIDNMLSTFKFIK